MLTHFTDLPAVLERHINTARASVFCVGPTTGDGTLLGQLARLSAAGVLVEAFFEDKSPPAFGEAAFTEFIKSGAKAYFTGDSFHNPFCVIDDHTLLVGPGLWRQNIAGNFNVLLVFENDPVLCGEYKRGFSPSGGALPDEHSAKTRLKAEILLLEAEIAALETEKAALLWQINAFEREAASELGLLISEKLKLEAELAALKAALTRKQGDRQQAESAQKNYTEYQKTAEEGFGPQPKAVPEEATADMKKMYREAMFMAHPDRFADEPDLQAEANRIAAELSAAYAAGDFEKLREIWQALKDGTAFKKHWTEENDIAKLQKMLEAMQAKLLALTEEIARLKKHRLFTDLPAYASSQEYFDAQKALIRQNIAILRNEILNFIL